MKITRMYIALFALNVSASVLAFNESQEYTKESAILLNQLQEHIKGTLIAVSNNEVKAGKDMKNFYYSISLPSQQLTNLGMVIDLDYADNSFKVLSVNPGSTADKLSIKSNDIILEINDVKINKTSKTEISQNLFNLIPGDNLKISLNSQGTIREISTKVTGQFVPDIKLELGTNNNFGDQENTLADESCGEVSVFFQPPVTREIYPASINGIDDDNRKRNWHSFRLPVGKHTVFLHEYIQDPYLASHRNNLQKAKSIEFDIQANKTYHLGAKFIRTKKFKTNKEDYWEPIIWKVSDRDCSL